VARDAADERNRARTARNANERCNPLRFGRIVTAECTGQPSFQRPAGRGTQVAEAGLNRELVSTIGTAQHALANPTVG
jgi:hypothetical protein